MLFNSRKKSSALEMIDDWKWIFSYSARHKGAIALYVFLGVLSTTLGLLSSVASKYLIDIITGYEVSKLALVAVIMVGSAVFGLFIESMVERLSAKLNVRISNDIRSDVFGKIVNADWLSMTEFANGDILNRLNSDVATVSGNAVSWLPSLVVAMYRLIATFFVILHYDWIMAVIALASAPFLLVFSRIFIKRQRECANDVKQTTSKLMSFEIESIYNFDTIKSFGIAKLYRRKMDEEQEKLKDANLKYNMLTIESNIFMTIVGLLVQFAAFGYCLFKLWTHTITFGTMTLFLQQRSNLTSAFNSIVKLVPTVLNCLVSARRIRELMELPSEKGEYDTPDIDAEAGLSIELENISFAYRKGDMVISSSSLKACPGEIVAIVGPSGEGKTTLIRLMLGLISPLDGSVSICTAEGEHIAMDASLRQLFAYVPQGNTMISGTIADNLRIAKEDATDEELICALKLACAWEFVNKMPNKLNSLLGEKGRGLSEGQSQRIAIARAILRNAPIILFDEATSALDAATERAVLRNITESSLNKTCIITTHRPSVLNLCKRIYRVVDKKVCELDSEETEKMAMDF